METLDSNPSPVRNRLMEQDLRISVVEPANSARWDEFVGNHANGNVCHSAAWLRILEQAFAHISGRFLALEEASTHRIVAGLPIYLVKSWFLGNRLVCVPFAAWCDPLAASGNQLALLLSAARERQGSEGVRFTEVRARRTAALLMACGLVRSRRWLHHFVPLDRSREDLWRNLSRTAVRRFVRLAEKSEVKVTRENSGEALRLFHDLLSRSRHRLGLPRIPIQFFRTVQRHLGTDGHALLLARRQGLPCGAIWATKCRTTFHLDYAGLVSEQVPPGSMQLLYWRALEMAQEEACAEFSLGRTNPDQEGLVAYKRHWGGVEEELGEFRACGAPRMDSKTRTGSVIRIARMLIRSLPRPLYGFAGDFFYRHR